MPRSNRIGLLGRMGIVVLLSALSLSGCRWFISHYDASAYQNFTNLKAFHIKFLEDNRADAGKTFDEERTKATCDAGELKFREATEYAVGKDDESRVKAIRYLHNVFRSDCGLALKNKTLFGNEYAKEQIEQATKNYHWAIAGESARVGSTAK